METEAARSCISRGGLSPHEGALSRPDAAHSPQSRAVALALADQTPNGGGGMADGAVFRQHRRGLPEQCSGAFRAGRHTHRQTCVIIGNGPSLRETDFSRLDGIDSFGLNRITLMREINGFVPTFHVVVNDLVIEQFSDEISR